jgi:Tol biopolymer transport system component
MDLPGLDSTAFAAVSPDVTADGRYVAFSARASHGHGDNRRSHVFVRDMQLNVTRRVGAGWAPSISGDGRYVSFVGPEDGLNHVFLADLHAGSTRLITKRPQGGRANGSSANPAVSSDGSVVVFQSQASDLVGGDDFNLLWDVFRYERSNGAIVRISGDPDEVWMEPSIGPSLDASGSVIAFSSRHPTGAADKLRRLYRRSEDQKIRRSEDQKIRRSEDQKIRRSRKLEDQRVGTFRTSRYHYEPEDLFLLYRSGCSNRRSPARNVVALKFIRSPTGQLLNLRYVIT